MQATPQLSKNKLNGSFESKRRWRLSNRKKHALTVQRWRERHPEEARKRAKECRRKYCENFPDRVKESQRKCYYWLNNDNQPRGRAYKKKQYAEDPNFRMRVNLSTRIRQALNGNSRSASTMKLVGCSLVDFRIYIETRFEPGMTWENYGRVWHVDHIMPCAIFGSGLL